MKLNHLLEGKITDNVTIQYKEWLIVLSLKHNFLLKDLRLFYSAKQLQPINLNNMDFIAIKVGLKISIRCC